MTLQAQEQNRHSWLAALGVDSWLPRGTLPGAAATAPWVSSFRYPDDRPDEDWQEDVSDYSVDASTASAKAMPSVASPPLQASPRVKIDTETLLDRRPPAAVMASPAPAPSRSPAASATVEPPRFKLAFLLRHDLLIIDSLPPHQPQGFSRQHRALLNGITSALGAGIDMELSDAMMLPWPMLASRTLNQGAEEARLAVQHKLKRTLESQSRVRHILLMGEAAAHWVLGETAPLESLQGRRFMLPSGLPVVVTLSLSELLRLPDRKAETWRDIQSLRPGQV